MNTQPGFAKHLEAIGVMKDHEIEGNFIEAAYAKKELRETRAVLEAARHEEIVSLLKELIAITRANKGVA